MTRFAAAALLAATALTPAARADEGMWTFDHFPTAAMRSALGAAPDQAWLDHVRDSSLRLAQGCSASIVSADGLVMTNHHCARDCTDGLSDAKHNYVRDGFLAASLADERKCPSLEANRLVAITDVTDEVHKATEGKDAAAFEAAERAAEAAITARCGTGVIIRCDVVKLYAGGQYALYRYDRYQDLRLVWSPEDQAANFGGDPDNFEFPRYALDSAFVRIYVDGKPFAAPDHLHLATNAPADGAIVFTSGNPGETERQNTVDQLTLSRDRVLPRFVADLSWVNGKLEQFATTSDEHARTALTDIFFNANSIKALEGQHLALSNAALMDQKRADEARLRERVGNDANLRDAKGAWDAIAAADARLRDTDDRYIALVSYPRFESALMPFAIGLVRAAAESTKPDGERLRGYTTAEAPALRATLLSPAPVFADVETVKLAAIFIKLRQLLGADDADTRMMLARDEPEALAAKLVHHTKLANVAERQKLLDGGAAAIAASTDPLIAFVRDRFDAPARAALAEHEAILATITRNTTAIAHAKFALDGTKIAPDATFSPRLSFGTVSGYDQPSGHVPPLTTWAGAFARETGAYPFTLPASWTAAKAALADGPLDVATTNDITGGNSGSPLIGLDGQAVGLIFDGNRQALADTYTYPGPLGGRAVAVTTAAIRRALTDIYRATRLLAELDK